MPPLARIHSSVWSITTNTPGLPLRLVAELVTCSIRPRGRFTNESRGSRPGYSSTAGPSRSISSSGTHVLRVWSSDTAATCTSGVRTRSQPMPTGSPSASQPSGTTGPRASAQAIAARNGDLPQPRGRDRTPRRTARFPAPGCSS